MDATACRYKMIFMNIFSIVIIYYVFYFIFENITRHTFDSFYIVGLCVSVNVNCTTVVGDGMIIVVTVKSRQQCRRHLGLVTPFGSIKGREVI
jgi:hypothetical protein